MASLLSNPAAAELLAFCEGRVEHYSTMFDGSSMSIEDRCEFEESRVLPWVRICDAIRHVDKLGFKKSIEVFLFDYESEDPDSPIALSRLADLANLS